MNAKWSQLNKNTHVTAQLAQLAIRAHKLVLTKRLKSIGSMVQIHLPTLQKNPKAQKLIEEMQEQLDNAQQALRGENP